MKYWGPNGWVLSKVGDLASHPNYGFLSTCILKPSQDKALAMFNYFAWVDCDISCSNLTIVAVICVRLLPTNCGPGCGCT